jgi:hypothetical protein
VAVGAATLHGRLECPPDLAARLRGLPAGVHLALPAGAVLLDPGVSRYRLLDDFEAALRL